jgi:hypothetical protein
MILLLFSLRSRYDHFSVLCELLPVAVPSLILSLQILQYQNLEKASTELFKFLKCDGGSLSKLEDCQWDGAELSHSLGTLQFYQVRIPPNAHQVVSCQGQGVVYDLLHFQRNLT